VAPRREAAAPGLRGTESLRADLDARGLQAAYLLAGEDRLSLDESVALLAERAVDPELAAFNTVTLRGDDSTWEEALAACEELPMMAPRRLVLVREPESLEGEASALVAYLKAPCATTTLVLASQRVDRRLSWVKALEASATCVAFAPPQGRELEAWIRRALSLRDVRIEEDALALLADLVQAETILLAQEIEKLALLCRDTGVATKDDVAAILGRTRTTEIWDLTNAVEDGDPERAAAAWRLLVEQRAAPVMVIAMLDWCLGRLLASEAPRAMPSRESVLRRRRDALSGQGERLLGLLRAADRMVRTTGGDAEAAIERLVLAASQPSFNLSPGRSA
jgi:DNA polymerase-3 subunit delta